MLVIVFVGVLVALLVWGVATYNRLVTERMKVRTQWSQVDVVLKQRFDMITKLLETVKGYAKHEQSTLQAVINARSGYLAAATPEEQMQASGELSGAMGRLMAVAESYPELKANQNFLHLQQQIAAIEEKLADYRQFYNDMVLRYNTLLVTIPTSLIAGVLQFRKEAFFRVEEAQKQDVSIEF